MFKLVFLQNQVYLFAGKSSITYFSTLMWRNAKSLPYPVGSSSIYGYGIPVC